MNRPHPSTFNRPLKFKLDKVDCAHQAVSELGIGTATATVLEIGYYAGPGLMAGRVVIPIYNPARALVAYGSLARNYDRSEKSLFLPSTFNSSLELYNLDRAISVDKCRVIVVQTLLDCIRGYQYGIQGIVASMQQRLSEEQEMMLVGNFDQVIFMFRGSDEGWSATQDAVRRLSTQLFVKASILPSGKSPAMLSKEDFLAALGA